MQALLVRTTLFSLAAAQLPTVNPLAPLNPVVPASKVWLGNVTSENTHDARDLGFQGKVGDCWINTFGDTFSCTDLNPQTGCNEADLFARNSAGLSNTDSPLSFSDIHFDSYTGNVDAQFVQDMGEENSTWPLGITNVVSTGGNSGLIYYLAGNGSNYDCDGNTCNYFQGAGVATVSVDDACDVTVSRSKINMWNGNSGIGKGSETYYGDHSALLAQDGYLYLYGSIPGSPTSAVGLARVQPCEATELRRYKYWNGTAFQSGRIYNPTDAVSVFNAGQGTVVWNEHYQRYLYFTASLYEVYCLSSETPYGPWSQPSVPLFDETDMPWHYDALGLQGFYTPTVQTKFSDPNGRYVVLWFTYITSATVLANQPHQILTAVNVTFV